MSKATELIEKYTMEEAGTDVPKDAKEAGSGFKDNNQATEFLGLMFGINPTSVTGGGKEGTANTFQVKGEVVAWLDAKKVLYISSQAFKKYSKGLR